MGLKKPIDLSKHILALLKKNKKKGCSRTEIIDSCRSVRIYEIQAALEELRLQELVESAMQSADGNRGGRPVQRWYLM